MLILLLLFGAAMVGFGLYQFAGSVFVFPSKATQLAFRHLRNGKKTTKQQLRDGLIMPLARVLSKTLNISDYKKRRLTTELNRIGIKKTPEEFIGENLSRSIWFGIVGLVFIPLGVPFMSILLVVMAIMLYQRNNKRISAQISKINREVEAELPRLVETLNYTLNDNNDLIAFFEKYRRVAGKALGSALDRLLLNMKTGNISDALREFERSLGIPNVSTLVSTLIGVSTGVDQRTALIVLEKDFRTRQREQLRREIDKQPRKVQKASLILTFAMIILMLVPLVVLIIQTFTKSGVS